MPFLHGFPCIYSCKSNSYRLQASPLTSISYEVIRATVGWSRRRTYACVETHAMVSTDLKTVKHTHTHTHSLPPSATAKQLRENSAKENTHLAPPLSCRVVPPSSIPSNATPRIGNNRWMPGRVQARLTKMESFTEKSLHGGTDFGSIKLGI